MMGNNPKQDLIMLRYTVLEIRPGKQLVRGGGGGGGGGGGATAYF